MMKRVLLLLYKAQHRLRCQICIKHSKQQNLAFGLVMTLTF